MKLRIIVFILEELWWLNEYVKVLILYVGCGRCLEYILLINEKLMFVFEEGRIEYIVVKML